MTGEAAEPVRHANDRGTGRPAGAGVVRGLVAVGVVACVVELAARWAKVDVDPRLAGLFAVVYATFSGGGLAGAAGVLAALGYCAYFYSPHGPRPHAWQARVYLLISFTLIAVATVTLVVALRRRAHRFASFELRQERGRSEAASRRGTEDLAREAALNHAVINSLPAHIAVLDRSGAIIATNKAWDEFASAAGAAVRTVGTGANYLHACAADDQAADAGRGIRAVLEGRSERFSTEYPCHGPGSHRWFLLAVTPLEGGRGAVVAHFDITDRREAEEALRRRADELASVAATLLRTNDELDQFAYVTSHDLRAPLRGIANLSSWIEEDMGDKFTPEAHQQMELLRGRVARMQAMIDGILEYSRVGRVKGPEQLVDVAALLAEVIDLLDPPTDFTVEVQAGMPMLTGERLRLQQVLMNLIGNAIKHNDKRPGRVSIGWRDLGAAYEFAIADNGPGIEPQFHERIFVIFQTLQPRDKVEGTGVGLSLVKKIVENAGGRVSVESEQGQGTTFRFTWPKRTAAGVATSDRPDETAATGERSPS